MVVEPPLDITHMEGNNNTMLEGEGGLSPPDTPGDNIFSDFDPEEDEHTDMEPLDHLEHHGEDDTSIAGGLLLPEPHVIPEPRKVAATSSKKTKPTQATNVLPPHWSVCATKPNSKFLDSDAWVVDERHHCAVVASAAAPSTTPASYKEAIVSVDADKWWAAMRAEYDAITRNNMYLLVDLLHGHCAIDAC